MSAPRFHCPQAAPGLAPGTVIALPAGAAHHAHRVLRLAEGAPVVLFDGRGGEYEARLLPGDGGAVQARIVAWDPVDRAPRLAVHLLQSLAATEKIDWVVEKAVELGCASVTPVGAARSVVRLHGERAVRRIAHWQALAVAASEQCGLNRLLQMRPVVPLRQAIDEAPAGLRLRLDPAAGASLPTRLAAVTGGEVTLAIGPEGGFDPEEQRWLEAAGFLDCTLGPRVLRTETAAIVAVAALRAIADDFRPSPSPCTPSPGARP